MSKLKQSIVAQRQIPEHIRESYPLFVEFIKAYYDFLQQTQAQNLEQIRDVDTTLDEFIDRFKSELAKNFPIHLASDKAKILKHLKEFYLSRGSADSFKFLFNVLFSKDAELFYPSTQILRASDGKWHQDVSIFVTPTDLNNKPAIKDLIGKFIVITNDKGKLIRSYVENAVQYSDTIYELFIQRDYLNEINVGAIVERDDNSFTGTVLQCPSKVKVYKSGKGFKVGGIYALKTQLGRGCVIKITKVDSEGGIKNIKVIRFGLDYKTKFYSYLSSKDVVAWEYVHPAQINHPYNPNEPHYTENSGGSMDYGWATKQTYFYYDSNIPVQPELDPARASDRFFADPAYVGEVVQQFYSDDSKNPLDEDLAIIEIELGAVAKYPGYYMKADGFISDEIYIQDGDYYQAFSYVIKVEEELRKYSDIVKALVHPAGMKVFSEYRIFNVLEVAAITRKITRILNLPHKSSSPSVATPTQRGFSYNNYITELYTNQDITLPSTLINGGYITYPDPIQNLEYPGSSGIIDARPGKAAKHSGKVISDSVLLTETRNFIIEKLLEDYITDRFNQVVSSDPSYKITRNFDEVINKELSKNVTDSINQYIETVVRDFSKNLTENINLPETISKEIDTIKTDIQFILDSYSLLVSKPITEVINDIIDSNVKLITKGFFENVITTEYKYVDYAKDLVDSVTLLETQMKEYSKTLTAETISVSESYKPEFIKNLNEVITNLERIESISNKSISEVVLSVENLSKDISKPLVDSFSLGETDSLESIKVFNDSINEIDIYILEARKLIEESLNILDYMGKDLNKGVFIENLNAIDSYKNSFERIFNDTISLTDTIALIRALLFYDTVDLTDSANNNFTKNLAELQEITDGGILRELKNAKSEFINISTIGRLRLAPYDQEAYFTVFDDYQPAIAIQ